MSEDLLILIPAVFISMTLGPLHIEAQIANVYSWDKTVDAHLQTPNVNPAKSLKTGFQDILNNRLFFLKK